MLFQAHADLFETSLEFLGVELVTLGHLATIVLQVRRIPGHPKLEYHGGEVVRDLSEHIVSPSFYSPFSNLNYTTKQTKN